MTDLLWALVAVAAVGVAFVAGRLVERARQRAARPLGTKLPQAAVDLANLTSAAVIFVGDEDEVLASTESARTLGLSRGSRVAHSLLLDLVRSTRKTREPVRVELDLPRGGVDTGTHLVIAVAPLTPDVVIVVGEDTSEALRVDATRRDFVANVSHELKTPIGAISLLSEAVLAATDDPAAVAKFAHRMQVESERLGDLVGHIVTLSRLQAVDPLHRAEPLDVTSMVAAAVDRSAALSRARKVNLTVTGRGVGEVAGDVGQLTDAVANLIRNAIMYSDEGARVAVSMRRRDVDGDDVVEISVTDNGIGIHADEHKRIFERFYRVDYGRSRDSGGTGLGLAIVRLVVEAHGGAVSVWSKLGQGSTFTIALPARETDVAEKRQSPTPQPEEATA